MILIGSKALSFYKPDRKVADIDLIATPLEASANFNVDLYNKSSVKVGNIELHNQKFLNNARLAEEAFPRIEIPELRWKVRLPSLPFLYALKRSHIHRPLAFSKHLMDLLWIKSQLKPCWYDVSFKFMKQRQRLTYKAFGQNVPSLNKTKDDFFDDAVDKIYIHDDIHEVVAFGDEPMFKKIQKSETIVHCFFDLWQELRYSDKVHCVQEEAMVIALERFIIPGRLKSQRVAFLKALEKICTTLTSGWFRDFAIDNYEACASNVPDYVTIFKRNEHKCRKLQKS